MNVYACFMPGKHFLHSTGMDLEHSKCVHVNQNCCNAPILKSGMDINCHFAHFCCVFVQLLTFFDGF